jgi:hypothetical protein
MNLKFPELGGGPEQGLNDAGVENFLGAIDVYVSRECGQNTGDAVRSEVQTARLEFDRLDIPVDEIPAFQELRAVLTTCAAHFRSLGKSKQKESDFFSQAVEVASHENVPVLKISDFGTTGLTGSDTDEKGRWFALVKSQGVSNKGDTAGGSFGIGKSSPFAASKFRTVFYGTRTTSDEVALQGVSRLVTHKGPGGKRTQGVGFIGDFDESGGEGGEPVFRAVRDSASFPKRFLRNEPGTDIWVVGYRSGDEWSRDLTRSILANFWPAIYRRHIEFRVGNQRIDAKNIAELIAKYAGQEDFEAHHFYRAIQSQPLKKKLKSVGDCELYLASGALDLPKRVCMVRGTGMRIFDYEPRACRVPFSGLFICTDVEGNKLLRQMEPPKHDTWDPKRIDGSEGKKALDEIKAWIREEVKKLNPLYAGKSFNESELAKYIPDADAEDLPQDSGGKSEEEESLEPKPSDLTIITKPTMAKPVSTSTSNEGDSGGGAPNGGGGGGGGDGGDGGGDGGGQGGGGGNTDPEIPRIKVRSFQSGPNEYELVLRSPTKFSGSIRVFAVGEDGTQDPVNLKAAALRESAQKFSTGGSSIQGVSLSASKPTRIVVTLDAIERRALTAVASQ